VEQREYPRASESSLRRTDGWRLLTCPVELLRWPGPGGGVAEPAGRVTWRAGDVTARRAEPLDRPPVPAARLPEAAGSPPDLVDAAMRSSERDAPAPPGCRDSFS